MFRRGGRLRCVARHLSISWPRCINQMLPVRFPLRCVASGDTTFFKILFLGSSLCFVHTKCVPFAVIFGFVQFGAIQLSIVVRLQMDVKKLLWLEWEFDSIRFSSTSTRKCCSVSGGGSIRLDLGSQKLLWLEASGRACSSRPNPSSPPSTSGASFVIV